MVTDVHLATVAAPALLKTVEEPPPSTVFVLVADDLPPSLATIVSRCVQIRFDPVSEASVAAWLVSNGVEAEHARSVAGAAGGRLDRARLLVTDAGFVGPTGAVAIGARPPRRHRGGRRRGGRRAAGRGGRGVGPAPRAARRRSWPSWPTRPR